MAVLGPIPGIFLILSGFKKDWLSLIKRKPLGLLSLLAILRGLNYNKDVIRKKLEHEDTTRKIKLPKGAKQKESRIEMDRGRKERKLKGDKQGISYAETPEKISKLPKGDRADKIEKYQELGESKKLPDIQLKKDVIAKDMQGNKITLKEGDVFSVYELPKSRYLLEGKESYTVPKNQFQNIKGQSIIAEAKEFAPELEGTEEDIKGLSKWQGDELYDNGKRLADVYKGEDGKWHYRSDFVEESPAFKTRQEAMENAEADALGIYSGNETKFSQYTLPDGENYREILIKAPESKVNEGDLISFKDWKKNNTYGTQEEYNKVIERAKKSMDKMVACSTLLECFLIISKILFETFSYKGISTPRKITSCSAFLAKRLAIVMG